MEQEQEEMNLESRRLKSVEEYEQEGKEMTEQSLTGLESEIEADPAAVNRAPVYQGRQGRAVQRGAAGDMVLRAAMLVAVLAAGADVFSSERLPQAAYDGVNDVLGRTAPRLVAQAAVWFRAPAALALLCLADAVLLGLYVVNDARARLLRMSPLVRTLFRGVLLPAMAVAVFVVTCGAWQLVRSEADASRRYGVEFSDRDVADSLVQTVVDGVAVLYRTPVLGDMLVANVLVVVLPTLALFPGRAAACLAPACCAAAVFVVAATFAAFVRLAQAAVAQRRARDVVAAIAFSVLAAACALLRAYYPQFFFGFLLTAALHVAGFVYALAEYLGQRPAVARAAQLDAARYPDYAEMQRLLPGLARAAAALRAARCVVVYVGDEVARASGTSLRNLGLCARWPALARLDVADNALAGALPDAVARLPRLEVLDVSYNRLTGLPAALAALPALRVLRAAANALTALPRALGDAPALQTLDVSGNRLARLPHELCGLEGTLRELHIYGNPLDPALADTAARKSVQGVLAYLRREEEECYLAGGSSGGGPDSVNAAGASSGASANASTAPMGALSPAASPRGGAGMGMLHKSVSVSQLLGRKSAAVIRARPGGAPPRHLGVMGLFGESPAGASAHGSSAGSEEARTKTAGSNATAANATTGTTTSGTPPSGSQHSLPTLREVLADPLGYQSLREFLCEECSEENLTFWSDVEQYRGLAGDDALREARRLYDRYLGVTTAKHEINVPGPVKSRLKRLIVDNHEAPPTVFDAAQKNVFDLMATDSFPRFLKSSYFEIYDGIRTHTK